MATAEIVESRNAGRVLVVDDDVIVLSGLALDLEEQGFAVSTAESAKEALGLIARQPVDLVLTDVVMDQMNGFDLLKSVRCNRPDLPVMLISGNGSIDAAVEGMRYGAVDYVQKPARAIDIAGKIKSVLQTASLRRNVEDERKKTFDHEREFTQGLLQSDRTTGMALLAEECAQALSSVLQPIRRHGRVIRDGLPEKSALRQYMREIERAGESLGEIADELHLLMGQWEAISEQVDLKSLVRHCFDSAEFRSLWKQHPHVRFITRLPEEPTMVKGYPVKIQLMLYHITGLLFAHASPGSTIEVHISRRFNENAGNRLAGSFRGPEICLHVSAPGDSGTRELCSQLWERCYQSHSRLSRFMEEWAASVVTRVIREHDGYIDLEKDDGAIVGLCVCLPESPVSAPTEMHLSAARNETILLLEDYPRLREAAANSLSELGYQMMQASNGGEAIEIAKEVHRRGGRLDLVILDLVLGETQDGVDVYKRLLETFPDQKAIVASGFAATERLAEARRLGIGQVLKKPYTMEDLAQAIRSELDRAWLPQSPTHREQR